MPRPTGIPRPPAPALAPPRNSFLLPLVDGPTSVPSTVNAVGGMEDTVPPKNQPRGAAQPLSFLPRDDNLLAIHPTVAPRVLLAARPRPPSLQRPLPSSAAMPRWILGFDSTAWHTRSFACGSSAVRQTSLLTRTHVYDTAHSILRLTHSRTTPFIRRQYELLFTVFNLFSPRRTGLVESPSPLYTSKLYLLKLPHGLQSRHVQPCERYVVHANLHHYNSLGM